MSTATDTIEQLANQEYKYGFVTLIEADTFPPGLNEDVVRAISLKKNEPEWMLEWRLKALRHWLTMTEPTWPNVHYPPPNSRTSSTTRRRRTEEADQPRRGRSGDCSRPSRSSASRSTSRSCLTGVAVDAVFDSVSVATTFKKQARRAGHHLLLVLRSGAGASRAGARSTSARSCRTPTTSSPTLNSAVFTDGSFVYIPKGVRCPMELSTYFRINAKDTGQFERTLIIAEEGAYVSYLEGCTAPMRDENQLHAAVVELVALDDAHDQVLAPCRTGTPATRTARAASTTSSPSAAPAAARTRKITWTQVETGSAITWKYPSCILQGDDSVGEFYSVALTNNKQQADTGTKMIHIGKNTRSTIVSKGISAGNGQNTYRGLVKILKGADERAQLLAVRLAADRRPVRRAHVPVHRGQEHDGAGRARSLHVEDRRGPDLLLQAARHLDRGRRQHDRQRLLQGGLPRAADGVRRRGAEAARREPGRSVG